MRGAGLPACPALLVLLLLVPPAAAAELYKWIDDTGVTHYGDRPAAAEAERIEVTGNTGPDPVMQQRRRQRQRLLKTFNEDRERLRAERQAALRERERLGRRCFRAQQQLRAMLDASYLYEKTGDPDNPRILTAQERRTETAILRERVEFRCE